MKDSAFVTQILRMKEEQALQERCSKVNTIGVIGRGFVGGAIETYFRVGGLRVLAYDKYGQSDAPLEEIVKQADVCFVAVPTPMREDGSCHTAIVTSVFAQIEETCWNAGLRGSANEKVFVLKSTVPPGFTETLRNRMPDLNIVFCPEFLTERNAFYDLATADRLVVGGNAHDAAVVHHAHVKAQRFGTRPIKLINMTPTEAEMVKLATNAMLFTKVLIANEIAAVCRALDISYDNVRDAVVLDERIGPSHTQVPGHDGELGAGGHCFPKDMHNLRHTANTLGVPERLLSAVLERNEAIRNRHDWKEMKGRAVI